MPLLPSVLAAGLNQIGFPKDASAVADAWFTAWWDYAQGMSYLQPGGGGRSAVEGSFKGIIMGVASPGLSEPQFFDGLGNAMKAAWATLGTTAFLLPAYSSATPAPAPFTPMAISIISIGKASSSNQTPRSQLADAIHSWTITNMAIPVTPPGGPPVPFS